MLRLLQITEILNLVHFVHSLEKFLRDLRKKYFNLLMPLKYFLLSTDCAIVIRGKPRTPVSPRRTASWRNIVAILTALVKSVGGAPRTFRYNIYRVGAIHESPETLLLCFQQYSKTWAYPHQLPLQNKPILPDTVIFSP